MQGELAGLADSPGEDSQGHPGQRRAAQHGRAGGHRHRRLPDVGDVEGVQPHGGKVVGFQEQVQYGDQEAYVAYSGDDEGLLGGSSGSGPLVPEADQEVRRHADQFPEGIELHNVAGEHQTQHGGGEQGHVGEVPGEPGVAVHVPYRIDLDQQADGGHHDQHHRGERVHQQAHLDRRPAVGQPVPALEHRAIVYYDGSQGDNGQDGGCGEGGDGAQGGQERPAVQERPDDQGDQYEGAQGKQENCPD